MSGTQGAGQAIVREVGVRRPGAARRAVTAVVATMCLAAAAGGAWLFLRARHPGYILTRYETATVTRKPLRSTTEFAGVVDFSVSRTLAAPAAAEVFSIRVQPGDDVRAGQVLVKLLSVDVETALALDEGTLQRAQTARDALVAGRAAEAARETREVALARARDGQAAAALDTARILYAKGFLSRVDRDAAELARAEAAAALAEAEARAEAGPATYARSLASMEQDIEEAAVRVERGRSLSAALVVRSPFDGTVVQVEVRVGQSVEDRAPLVVVADRSAPIVRFDVPEYQARALHQGEAVTIRVGESRFDGMVTTVGAAATGATQATIATVAMTAAFREPPAGLLSGSSAGVEVVLGSRPDALVLPRGPFLGGGNESWVYVVQGEVALKTPVSVGLQNPTEVEIQRGVQEGDLVIVSSYEEFITRESVSLDRKGGTER